MNSPLGNGKIRITTAQATNSTFANPSGDFTSFNTNLGNCIQPIRRQVQRTGWRMVYQRMEIYYFLHWEDPIFYSLTTMSLSMEIVQKRERMQIHGCFHAGQEPIRFRLQSLLQKQLPLTGI
jgi:hypothetical protein